MAIFKGAGVAIVTPMNEDGSVNYEKFGELIEFQIANGTDAIIVCGTTGESSTLTHEEHLDTIKYCVDKVAKRIPVVAGTGSNCTETAVYLSQEAEKYGVLPMFYLELSSGLRRGELLALQWEDLNVKERILTVNKQVTRMEGELDVTEPKTKNSVRKVALSQQAVDLLVQEHEQHPDNPILFPSPRTGGYWSPDAVSRINRKLLKNAGIEEHVRFHDLRHPYVKHTTKIFSLRLMDFQAQACPDARRKTRGACQLLRVGQSRSPVRPLCNRKRFSCLPPQSKMSWILYAISMRLSGYTSTRSISISASSVVSASASKIALDASFRLSCRACSSCFCFACANTAA